MRPGEPGGMAVAKARPVAGLDAKASIFVNAALIIGTRLNELIEYEPHLADATAVYAHHQMRIASKRLRYTMELFQDLYSLHTAHGKEFTAAIGEVESIQKHLGEIHGAAVLVP